MAGIKSVTGLIGAVLLCAWPLLGVGGCQGSACCRDLVTGPSEAPANIEGKWVGKWYCETTGHSGKLRCRLTQVGPDKYKARYDGTYQKFIPFWYTVEMQVEQREGVSHLNAEANLGWLGGGKYLYQGTIEGDAFLTSYTSDHHNGTFELTRAPQ